ncbi:rubredoxin [Bradyrhizobium sp. CCGUVB1N3]|nr:rubredoxin [Bradyrhizobium sp. CCGUVB1N3]MCP3476023.1 rubredoxin [Bradyrhizobium sp. CCGUVB1N3]
MLHSVYDPADGEGQVAPRTRIAALPQDRHCPDCDASRSNFLAMEW